MGMIVPRAEKSIPRPPHQIDMERGFDSGTQEAGIGSRCR